jgi:3-oxoacyl-[acyl-carrier protein] reductase
LPPPRACRVVDSCGDNDGFDETESLAKTDGTMTAQTKSRITTDLGGKVAIVTGAGRGLGRCIAESLAGCGAKVACVDVNAELLNQAVAAITEAGGTAMALTCDVTNSEQVNGAVDAVVKAYGGLNILVNNAGITRDNLVIRMKDEQWDAVLNINLKGTFLFTRAAARPMMKSRDGRIINIASVSGLMGNPGQCNYSASKAAVMGFTRTVAKELSSRKITVNAVAPGFIATEMVAKMVAEAGEDALAERTKQIPLGRLGDPLDIADAVLFLASDAACYITGHTLVVDGGLTE